MLTNQSILASKDDRHISLHEEWSSDSKYTHHLSNERTVWSFDKEKTYTNSKLPLKSTTFDTEFQFETSSRNFCNFDDWEKSRPLKPNCFSRSTYISNPSGSGVGLEHTYGTYFDKSNQSFSQQFDHHSSANFKEVR